VTVLGGGRPLRHGEHVTVHHGTAELHARVVLRDAAELAPGATGRAQLRLESPAVAAAGDRVILRLTGPSTTVAGGVVSNPLPSRSGEAAPPPPVEAPPAATAAAPPPGADQLARRLRSEWLAPSPLAPDERSAAAYLAANGAAVRAGRDLAFAAEAYAAARDALDDLPLASGIAVAPPRDGTGGRRGTGDGRVPDGVLCRAAGGRRGDRGGRARGRVGRVRRRRHGRLPPRPVSGDGWCSPRCSRA